MGLKRPIFVATNNHELREMMTEGLLISRCKAGERQALDQLYQQYKPQLLNICKQYTNEASVAEDLLHDAFVVILTSLDKLRSDDKVEAWMTSIVRNVGYHYREHLAKEQATLQQIKIENEGATATILSPDYEQLQKLVSQLPQGYQQVFRLSVFEGLSHQEISQLLGIAPHSSSSQLSHAKRMLQALIKQSWVLILLLIAIPTAVWKLMQSEESGKGEDSQSAMVTSPNPSCRRGNRAEIPTKIQENTAEVPSKIQGNTTEISSKMQGNMAEIPTKTQGNMVTSRIVTHVLPLQGELEEVTDSIPYYIIKNQIDTLTETAQQELEMRSEKFLDEPSGKAEREVRGERNVSVADSREESNLSPLTSHHSPLISSWDIRLAYNGQMGQRDDYLAATTIGKGSFDAASNGPIPAEYGYDNWIGYNDYLNNSPLVSDDAETRSLMNIAAQNCAINDGMMEAHYEHHLPVTIQLMFTSHLSPLTSHLYIETGLSYTRLSSTIKTGSSEAYIQERQRLHYLGIPLRLGWQWYSKAHLSLYSSAGAMLELPIRGLSDINHIDNGISTYQKEETLSVPCQWSTTLGLGLQYDITPHLGIYLEPSLQYFFDDGSDLKTYRTEHPFSVTLPLGIRFRW